MERAAPKLLSTAAEMVSPAVSLKIPEQFPELTLFVASPAVCPGYEITHLKDGRYVVLLVLMVTSIVELSFTVPGLKPILKLTI